MNYHRHEPQPRIFTGSYDPGIAERIATELSLPLDPALVTDFSNTEVKAEVPTPAKKNHDVHIDAVRGDYVFIVQSHGSNERKSVNDILMEHVALINAAKRGSAARVVAVIPYRSYSRADRPDNSHESYMGPIVMRLLLAAGADQIIEVDPHSGQAAGFMPDFSTEYTPIPAFPAVDEYIKTLYDPKDRDDFVVVAPDSGRTKMTNEYASRLSLGHAIVEKVRTGTNEVRIGRVVGDVVDKHCIVIDDMIDTGGTILQGAQVLRKAGARDVTIVTTHGILSGGVIENISRAKKQNIVGRVAVGDTLLLPKHTPDGLVDTFSVVPLLAKAIERVYNGESVSEAFN